MRIEERVIHLPAGQGARVVALGLLAEATEAANALAAGKGEEPLHDFRVAVRRLRTALRTYRPWLEGALRPRHERRLRKIARSTNAARDAEVQLAWLAARREAFASAQRRPGWELAVGRCEARAHGVRDAARVAARFQRLGDELRRRLEAPARTDAADPGERFGGALAALLRDHALAVGARVRAIRDGSDRKRVHRARIAGKRLRYLVEPLRGYPPAGAKAAIGRLKRLQDVLGELHDAHVLAAELRDALVDSAAERARRLHAAAYARETGAASIRGALRASPRPGLLALVALVRERREALFADLEREWRAGGMEALAADLGVVAAAVEARAARPGSPTPGGGAPRAAARPSGVPPASPLTARTGG